ncbi:hypothetical protein BDW67DRAFT_189634 [Aspergillus spinulosporus]
MAKNLELCLHEDWCKALEKHFQLPLLQARKHLDQTQYTIADVRNRVPLSMYISTVLSLAKQCGKASEFDIVLRAWRNINIKLRSNIPEPKKGTTIKRFIRELQQWETNWYNKYAAAPCYITPQVVTPVQAYYGQRIGGRISQMDAIYGPCQYQRTQYPTPPSPSFTLIPSAASPQQITNLFHGLFPLTDNKNQFRHNQGGFRGSFRGSFQARGSFQNHGGYTTYPGRY